MCRRFVVLHSSAAQTHVCIEGWSIRPQSDPCTFQSAIPSPHTATCMYQSQSQPLGDSRVIHSSARPLNIQWSSIHRSMLDCPHSTFSGHPFTHQCWPIPTQHSVVTHSPTSAGLSIFTKHPNSHIQWSPIHRPVLAHPHSHIQWSPIHRPVPVYPFLQNAHVTYRQSVQLPSDQPTCQKLACPPRWEAPPCSLEPERPPLSGSPCTLQMAATIGWTLSATLPNRNLN